MAKTQLDHLKAHLSSGKSITPLEALGLYGVFRLAARMKELRDKGWNINTEIRYDPNGKTYATYTLVPLVDPELPVRYLPDRYQVMAQLYGAESC